MAGFAHAGDDHPAARAADQIDRRDERSPEPVGDGVAQCGDARRSGFERAHRGSDEIAAVCARRPLGTQRLRLGHGLQRRSGGWANPDSTNRALKGHRHRAINASLTITVLVSLTKGYRPVNCPSPARGRRPDIGFNILIAKRFPVLGCEQGSASSDLGKSQLLRRRRSMLAIAVGAAALWTALGPLAERAHAQGAANSDPFLRPVLDGDPRNPPRFSNSRNQARESDTSRFTACRTTAISRRSAPARPASIPPVRRAGRKP